MHLKKNIATSENGFVFNPATGDSFSANGTAAEILAAMKGGETEEQIKQRLLEKYEVSRQQLDRDWIDWMTQLKEANLLDA